MKEQVNLEKLGEEISKDFVERGEPMNKSLQKLASYHGLNTMQVSRVAEHANVKTHLHMLSNTEEPAAYVNFPVADPNVITAKPILKEAEYSSDYNLRPNNSEITAFEDIFFKKTASETEPATLLSATQKYKESREKVASLSHKHNQLMEAAMVLETSLTPIYKLTKQAALSGVSPEALSYVIKTSADTGDYIIEQLDPLLKKDGITLVSEFSEKTASQKINPENELYIKVTEFDKLAKEIIGMHNNFEVSLSELGDHPLEKQAQGSLAWVWGNVKSLASFAKKHPVLTALGAGVAGGRFISSNADTLKHQKQLAQSIKIGPTRG